MTSYPVESRLIYSETIIIQELRIQFTKMKYVEATNKYTDVCQASTLFTNSLLILCVMMSAMMTEMTSSIPSKLHLIYISPKAHNFRIDSLDIYL